MVRFKNRYITVQIEDGRDFGRPLEIRSQDLYNEVLHAIQYMHGDFGCAAIKSGLNLKYCNENTRIAIIRVRHGPHKYVTSSLPFVTKVRNKKVSLRIMYVGATLHHCYKVIVRHQKAELSKVLQHLKTEEERLEFKNKMLNLNIISTRS